MLKRYLLELLADTGTIFSRARLLSTTITALLSAILVVSVWTTGSDFLRSLNPLFKSIAIPTGFVSLFFTFVLLFLSPYRAWKQKATRLDQIDSARPLIRLIDTRIFRTGFPTKPFSGEEGLFAVSYEAQARFANCPPHKSASSIAEAVVAKVVVFPEGELVPISSFYARWQETNSAAMAMEPNDYPHPLGLFFKRHHDENCFGMDGSEESQSPQLVIKPGGYRVGIRLSGRSIYQVFQLRLVNSGRDEDLSLELLPEEIKAREREAQELLASDPVLQRELIASIERVKSRLQEPGQ